MGLFESWLVLAFCSGLIFNLRMNKLNHKKGGVEQSMVEWASREKEFWDANEWQLRVLYRFVLCGFCFLVWPLVLYWVLHSYFRPTEYVL